MTNDNATPRPWRGTGKITDDANAELIVRAVNSFDGLLEACKSSKLAMEISGFASGYGKKVYDRVCQTIQKAEK